MGASASNTNTNISSKCNLDGTELYDSSGQTIADITELTPEEIDRLIDDYFEEVM